MQKILMFTMAACPYCRAAHKWMNELLAEHPEYHEAPIEIVDEVEQPARADTYDYYYVPTYYVGDVKVHEGVATKEIVEDVYLMALGQREVMALSKPRLRRT